MNFSELETRVAEVIARSAKSGALSESEFNETAVAIYQFQRENNLPYRQFCEYSGAPATITDWRAIPTVPTSAFKHAALRTFGEEETVATFRTSGTTGEGYGTHYFRSLALYESSILQGWKALNIPQLPQVILTQRPADAPHSSLVHMMQTLSKLNAPGREQVWCISKDGSLDVAGLRAAAQSGPVLLLGTALAFLHLFETLGGEALPLQPGSIAMETGGYKGTGRTLSKAELYAMFREKLALDFDAIWNEYSMTELSSQWYTHGLGRPHFGPPWARALVLDPTTSREVEDGAQGVIRLFDLANVGSVLAIQTQDLAIRRGNGFELLGRDPNAIPRGCSRSADELLSGQARQSRY